MVSPSHSCVSLCKPLGVPKDRHGFGTQVILVPSYLCPCPIPFLNFAHMFQKQCLQNFLEGVRMTEKCKNLNS